MRAPDRAQTEVIGTVLLVGVVVISTSVVGVFYLSSLDRVEEPVVELSGSVTTGTVSLTHEFGEGLDPDTLTVVLRARGSERRIEFDPEGIEGDDDRQFEAGERWTASHDLPLAAGDRVRLVVIDIGVQSVLLSGRRTVQNQPPTANFTYSPAAPTTADAVNFTDASTDDDGNVTAWRWTFGDGTSSTARHPNHTYSSPGNYTVTLRVTDDDGSAASVSTVVVVNHPLTYVEGSAVASGPATATDAYGVKFSLENDAASDATITGITITSAPGDRIRETNAGDGAWNREVFVDTDGTATLNNLGSDGYADDGDLLTGDGYLHGTQITLQDGAVVANGSTVDVYLYEFRRNGDDAVPTSGSQITLTIHYAIDGTSASYTVTFTVA